MINERKNSMTSRLIPKGIEKPQLDKRHTKSLALKIGKVFGKIS